MRYPQVLIYETDGRLAQLLRPLAEQRRWSLREPRQRSACLRLIRRAGPNLLVIAVGRDLEQELGLLDRVKQLYPETAVVLVTERDSPRLAALGWDLGADFVLVPPHPRDDLIEIAAGLMSVPGQATSEGRGT
jgi:DNA-binding response OmpR family regulator